VQNHPGGEFGLKYVAYAKANKRSWERDVQMLDHIQEFLGNRKLSEIRPAGVEEYKSRRCALAKQSTVNRELALFKRLFNLASVWDLFHEGNPVCKVRFFREDSVRLRTSSLEEESALVYHAAPRLQDLILSALNTGMLIGKIFSLCWPDVDIAQGIISVRAPQTGKVREVPINEITERILQFRFLGKRNEYVFL
jgi:integrase